MPDASLLSVLPNLSIGVVAVICLVLVVKWFLAALDVRAQSHETAMREREKALREVEADVRSHLVRALGESTRVISENTKLMERVVHHLDGSKR